MFLRRGGAYVLVLIVSSVAATIAIGGLALRQASAERGNAIRDLASARLLAQSGIETVLQWGAENSGWRAEGDPNLTFNLTLGQGILTIKVSDPTDGDLTDDENDPYQVTCAAKIRDSRAVLSVDVAIPPPDTTFRDRVLSANPVGFWPLDENANELNASALVGSQQGSYSNTSVAGVLIGSDGRDAPQFTTTSNYVTIPHHNELLLNKGTLICSVYCQAESQTDSQTILAKDLPGEDGNGHLRLYIKKRSLDLFVRIENSDETLDFKAATLSLSTWHYITVTSDNNGLAVYVDGTRTNTFNDFTTFLGPDAGGSGNQLDMFVGAGYNGTSMVKSLNGSVRDVVFFDYAVSEAENFELLFGPTADHAIDPESWAWVVN